MTPPRSTGDYRHDEKRRKNNPPVGMVAYDVKTAEQPPAHYGYDPHLSPQLVWAGKPGLVDIEVEDAAGLAVDTVSLHIYERISTQAIIHAVQLDLFSSHYGPRMDAAAYPGYNSAIDRPHPRLCRMGSSTGERPMRSGMRLCATIRDDLIGQSPSAS
jgi:hypothetical protein